MINVMETRYKVTMQWGIDGYQDPYAKVKSSVYTVNALNSLKKCVKKVVLYDCDTNKYIWFDNSYDAAKFISTHTFKQIQEKNIKQYIFIQQKVINRFYVGRSEEGLKNIVSKKDEKRIMRKVYCETNDKYYKNAKQAAKDTGISPSFLQKLLRKSGNCTCKGYQFRYA